MTVRKIKPNEMEEIKKLSSELDPLIHNVITGFFDLNQDKNANIFTAAIRASLTNATLKSYIVFLDMVDENDFEFAKTSFTDEIDKICQFLKKSVLEFKQ